MKKKQINKMYVIESVNLFTSIINLGTQDLYYRNFIGLIYPQ